MAVLGIGRLRRERCRRMFEERFDASRMALDYVAVYRGLDPGRGKPGGARSEAGGRP
jgi:hypothetical protein